jgi:hypothetical protein
MMAKWDVMGLQLGYTKVSSLGDQITVSDGAIEGIVKNLAVSMWPQFSAPGTPINQILMLEAKDGLDAVRMVALDSIGPSFYPDTLPIGSGNEWDGSFNTDHFYTEPSEEVLTESGGFISVESGTELP